MEANNKRYSHLLQLLLHCISIIILFINIIALYATPSSWEKSVIQSYSLTQNKTQNRAT